MKLFTISEEKLREFLDLHAQGMDLEDEVVSLFFKAFKCVAWRMRRTCYGAYDEED